MKVIHINTGAFKGGAAIACNRLNEALKMNEVSSSIVN